MLSFFEISLTKGHMTPPHTLPRALERMIKLNSVSSTFPLWLSVSWGSRGASVRLHPGVRDAQLGRRGRSRAPPAQGRANEGPGGCRPSGYADHGLIGLMRCSSSSARSGTAGRSRTKQGGEAYCWALRVRERRFVELFLSDVENAYLGHSEGRWIIVSKIFFGTKKNLIRDLS